MFKLSLRKTKCRENGDQYLEIKKNQNYVNCLSPSNSDCRNNIGYRK